MSMMGLPLQAHTNVKDVLAPLFSNGRSFSSLIDELSKHFKLEQREGGGTGSQYPSYGAYGDDPAGMLDASSESQSTDSEAEVCVLILLFGRENRLLCNSRGRHIGMNVQIYVQKVAAAVIVVEPAAADANSSLGFWMGSQKWFSLYPGPRDESWAS